MKTEIKQENGSYSVYVDKTLIAWGLDKKAFHAVEAFLNGEFDNHYLIGVGLLYNDHVKNIEAIALHYGGNTSKDYDTVSQNRNYKKIFELMSITKDVHAFEFEGVIFKGYRPDSIKNYIDLNESRPFYVWLHDTHVILNPLNNKKS